MLLLCLSSLSWLHFVFVYRVLTAVERNECVSLRLAHLNILKSATKHSSGLSWIKESEAWKFAIEYYEKCHTVYILRESADFLFNLLIKCSEVLLDDRQCEDIIQELLKPLLNYPWSGESNILLVDNQNDQRVFIPMLTMISTSEFAILTWCRCSLFKFLFL